MLTITWYVRILSSVAPMLISLIRTGFHFCTFLYIIIRIRTPSITHIMACFIVSLILYCMPFKLIVSLYLFQWPLPLEAAQAS